MPKAPNVIDVLVGGRIRARRKALRLSQTDLANQLGIVFQQVQKYEKGTARVSAGRLQHVAQILDIPIKDLFSEAVSGFSKNSAASPLNVESASWHASQEEITLSTFFLQIKQPNTRRKVIALIEAIAAGS